MAYSVEFKPSGLRDFRRLPPPIQVRIGKKLDLLAAVARPPGCLKLEGSDAYYRIRVGDYRLIHGVDDPEKTIWIVKIGHRGDVYRRR